MSPQQSVREAVKNVVRDMHSMGDLGSGGEQQVRGTVLAVRH